MNPETARRITIAIAKDQLAGAIFALMRLERAIGTLTAAAKYPMAGDENWPWILREIRRGRLRAALADRIATWDRYLTRQVNRSPARQGMERAGGPAPTFQELDYRYPRRMWRPGDVIAQGVK